MWSSGDVVALRDVWFGNVWRAVAGIVIEDRPGRSAFYVPADSASAYPVDPSGREIRLARPEVVHAMRRTTSPCVVLCDEHAPWTVWHFFADDGLFDRWYVNFERFLGRSVVAYDSVDHKLDLIVRPGRRLEWKDEDELEEAGRLGLVDVDAVRRAAARALAEQPWPSGWETWRPDPSWRPPELPDGWDRV